MKFLIVVFCAISVTLATDYCNNKQLCTIYNGVGYDVFDHIACPGVAEKVGTCPAGGKAITMTDALKAQIVSKHNKYRNDLAGGSFSGFAKASGMTEMSWDDELAFVASKNAMTCKFAHDDCRNTDAFPSAGQNLAIKWMSTLPTNDIDNYKFYETMMEGWWNEIKDANQAVMDSFHDTGATIGHFTQMAHEGAYKIGCAISEFPETKLISGRTWNGGSRYLVCNYAITNILDQPIYKSGTPQTTCKSGKSTTYGNLCSSNY